MTIATVITMITTIETLMKLKLEATLQRYLSYHREIQGLIR